MTKEKLTSIHDNRKDFYGKAIVETDDNGDKKLFSYGTLVAKIENGKPYALDNQSQTTKRHIKEFLKQNGFDVNNATLLEESKSVSKLIKLLEAVTGKKVILQESKTEFSEKEREGLAEKGEAMPDGSFPIRNEQDLKDAIKSYGLSKNKAKAKNWIEKRAKELGKEDLLPKSW